VTAALVGEGDPPAGPGRRPGRGVFLPHTVGPGRFQLPVPPMVVPTLVKVLLALLPSAVMAALQQTMIRASITAHSTAVGPLSSFRKLTRAVPRLRMGLSFRAVACGVGR